ncbi:MAG: DUF1236 domain-containing protein [Pseudolabrys sp.]|nr:DUF1236 domain-containing protein [Pseudolabrys sp.]
MKPGENKAEGKKAPETTGQGNMKSQEPGRSTTPLATGKPAASTLGATSDVKTDAKADQKASENAGAKEAAPASAKPAGEDKSSATTGQGAGASSAKLSAEQNTKISAIIKQQKVAPAQLTVSVRVGTRVPDSVRFYPLPQEVFVIYPAWRGYDYILVGNEILVIDPRTHEIVAIIEA